MNGKKVCENTGQYGRIDEIFHFLIRHNFSNEVTGPHFSGLSLMRELTYGGRDGCLGTTTSWGCLLLDQYITFHPSLIFVFAFNTET